MITINTQQELEALIDDNGNIVIEDDLKINCNIEINANISAWNLNVWNLKARNINCFNINALDIDALDINAGDIEARDINAGDIKAWNINAEKYFIKPLNIEAARDIYAMGDIKADNISYYAACFAYNSIICKSIKGRRDNSKHFVLDGTITETNNS